MQPGKTNRKAAGSEHRTTARPNLLMVILGALLDLPAFMLPSWLFIAWVCYVAWSAWWL